jgi:hypothetical protein
MDHLGQAFLLSRCGSTDLLGRLGGTSVTSDLVYVAGVPARATCVPAIWKPKRVVAETLREFASEGFTADWCSRDCMMSYGMGQ